MNREQLLEERCARFRYLIQYLNSYINDRHPIRVCADDWYHKGRITLNDARYLSGLPEVEQTTKPPLGVIPKYIWDRKRQEELAAAMQRYLEAGKSIPREWIDGSSDIGYIGTITGNRFVVKFLDKYSHQKHIKYFTREES